jgi:putative ABC transport system permease protein
MGDVVPGVSLVRSEDALGPVRGQVQALTASLLVVGAGILFTAGFLIYLTLSLSVAERTRLYGTVHALGATPRQVRRVVVAEALAVGLLGSVIGSGLGVGIAMVLRWATARLLAIIGGGGLVIRPTTFVAGIAMGVVTTVASALGPARRAARVEAIEAIRTTTDPPPERDRWKRGLVLVVTGGTLLVVGTSTTVLGAAVILVLLGSIWLVPPMIGPLASVLGRVTARASRGVGRVAVEHLVAERTRSAYTLALVMLVMAMAIAGAAIHVSFTSSIDRQNDAEFAGGLTLFAASTFPDTMVQEVAEQPGVVAVTARGNGTAAIVGKGPDRDVIVRSLDADTFFDVSGFRFETGDPDAVRAGFARGRSVVVPKSTAHNLGVEVGDELVLSTAEGPVPFRVVATVELSNIPAVLIVSDQDGRSLFSITGNNEVQIRLEPGADAATVGHALERDLAERGPFLVVTTDQLKADTRAQIGAGINGFFILILLAGVVGMFGLANTMVVSVTTRLREIGVLRAVGARRAQVRRMVMIEAVTLVLVAVVLAVPLGIALSRPLLQAVQATLVDTTVDYAFPLAVVPVLTVVGLVVAVLASLWPVRRAVTTDIDVALRYE